MTRFVVFTLALAACATDPVDDVDLPDVTGDTSGTIVDEPVVARHEARDLRMTCATRLDGVDELRITVTSDVGVALAFVQLRAGELEEALELDGLRFPEFIEVNGVLVQSHTSVVSTGKLVIDDSTPITCANLGDFGAHATVIFTDGGTACAVAGNAEEAGGFECN